MKNVFSTFTTKLGKNIYELSEEEKEVINEIIKLCFATIHHFNATHRGDPKRYVQEVLGISKTDSDLARAYTILNATKLPPDQGFFSKDLNKKLADTILGSAE